METLRDSVTRPSAIRCRPEAEGRFLLYNPATDELHVIGPVEKSIYDLCDGRTIDEIVEQARPLVSPLGIDDPVVAGREVLGFLRALATRGLVAYQ